MSFATSGSAQPRQRQNIDVERFKPAVTYDGFVDAEGSQTRGVADRWQFGLFTNYAVAPLVVVGANNKISHRFVKGRLGFDAIASLSILDWLALGVDVPFFLAQTGDEKPSFAGLGDIRLVPKVRLLDDRKVVGLGLVAELRLPTHVGDYSGGARNVVFVPRVVADHRFGRTGFRLGANAGAAIRQGTHFENVSAGCELVYAAAVSYRIGGWNGVAEVGGEVEGATGLAQINLEELPLEGRVFAKIHPSPQWEISGGPAIGIIPGYGIPTFRAFLGVRYTPTSHDRDGDGIPDDEDKCPDVAEDRDGYQDLDGCPEDDDERDDDHDGVPNSEDKCPTQPETINGFQDDDGCPDEGPIKVVREKDRVLVLDNIEFASASASISPKSYGILDQLALLLKANADITHMRIEGHTDSAGPADFNKNLSQRRASAVRNYLIGRHINPGRLTAQGFGEERPLVPETDAVAMQKNRRVEFIITDQSGTGSASAPNPPPPPAPKPQPPPAPKPDPPAPSGL